MEQDGGISKRQSALQKYGPASVWSGLRSNLKSKGFWQELSGSLGDLGTFVPIVLALGLVNGLHLGTTLIFTGLYNIITGGLFGVPMPVQPMKSIAAVAIAQGDPLTIPQIMAAGICVSSLLLFLGVTRLMTLVQYLVPLPMVRGIQLSQGIQFGMTAVKYLLKQQNLKTNKSKGERDWWGEDGIFLGLSAFVFVCLVSGAGGASARQCGVVHNPDRRASRIEGEGPEKITPRDEESGGEFHDQRAGPKFDHNNREVPMNIRAKIMYAIPSALIVFVVGVGIAIGRNTKVFKGWKWGPQSWHVVHISSHDWKVGFTRAAVPQIPLSLLNSVIAVCKLSNDLFPEKHVSPLMVSSSVGMMNLVGCWFGAMPCCHGAGGLAGQYRFGARSGLSVAMLGTFKLGLGIVIGKSLLNLLAQFPIALLGVLLFFSGLELAMQCRDQTSRLSSFMTLVVTIVALATDNTTKGFLTGLVIWVVVLIHDLLVGNRQFPRSIGSLKEFRN